MKRALLILTLLAPVPASAAEWAHCYTGEAPADAKLWTQLPPPMLKFSEYLGIAAIRHACGADTTVDRQLMQSEMESAECSATSEIANYAGDLMSAPSEVLAAEYAKQLGTDAAGFEAFCGALSACEPTLEGAYSEACDEALKKAVGG